MNSKTVKLIRKFCKIYGRSYKAYKKAFRAAIPEDQVKVINNMRIAVYGSKKS